MQQQAKVKGLTSQELDELAINTIRTLSIDAVQQANSGHPGTPMALAPLVYVIWNEVMRFDPQDPIWPNRDRFVLSNGHASMLLWSVLFLTRTRAVNAQYERLGEPAVTLDDIRHFRQLGSKAPGHPEYHLVSGVEATTGPLGQGIATSVGMAMARKWLGSHYNKPGFDLFDYNIYAICGDGCMMEGVSSEAASLAGHLALDDLCWIYDNNHITIDGKTKITFTEDVAARFLAYHWNVLRVGDANDLESIEEALAVFRKTKDRPTLIILDSHIGYGSPHKVDTPAAHGEPLGEDEVKLVKRAYHWPENAKFLVPDGVIEHFADGIGQRGGKARRDWEAMFSKYRDRFPDLATEIDLMQRRELPPVGIATCRVSRRIPKESRGAMRPAKCSMSLLKIFPGFSAARPILHRQAGRCSNSAAPGNSNRALPKAAIFISASASTRWRRSSTVCRSRSCGRSDRPSSSSATMRGRPFGSPRLWNCRPFSFLLTMPWATVKTDRRISRLSS
jgi:transketolase